MFMEKHSIEPDVFINILSSIIGRQQDWVTVDIEAAKQHISFEYGKRLVVERNLIIIFFSLILLVY